MDTQASVRRATVQELAAALGGPGCQVVDAREPAGLEAPPWNRGSTGCRAA